MRWQIMPVMEAIKTLMEPQLAVGSRSCSAAVDYFTYNVVIPDLSRAAETGKRFPALPNRSQKTNQKNII